MSFEAQSFFVRILTLVDDFGRYDGRVLILHGHCFALRPDIAPQRTEELRDELQESGLIEVYAVDSKDFIQVAKWHERTRCDKSKYPDPPSNGSNPQESAADRSGAQEKDASLVPRPSSLAIVHRPSSISEADASSSAADAADAGEKISCAEIFNLFSQRCPSLPKLKDQSEERKVAIRSRWKAARKNGQEPQVWFTELFTAAEASDFIAGRTGRTAFGFDWLLKPANARKVLEGNYANSRQNGASTNGNKGEHRPASPLPDNAKF